MDVFKSWVIFIFFLLIIVMIPYSSSLSFNLSTIGPSDTNTNINITGDAYISNQGIQVTPDERHTALGGRVGRATYIKPLHLWDNGSRNLTDFNTHFSFIIDSNGSSTFADGLTFFLAPVGSTIPNYSAGSGIGLVGFNGTTNTSSDLFVAVEFDTFPNAWDPLNPHVGINLNSMNSVVTADWGNDISLGRENDAWITYNSITKNLKVVFTAFMNNRIRRGSVNCTVDLRDLLPEWVIVGFSAATGNFFEKNNVKSWDFYSSLEINQTGNGTVNPGAVSPSSNPEPNLVFGRRRKNRFGLVVGLSIGVCALVGGLALFGYGLWRRKKGEEKEVELTFDLYMDSEFEKGTGPKKYSYGELASATNNFSEEEKLGEGGFGGVYRGFLKELDSYVAVKRVSRGSKQGAKEYASEVKIISRLRHRNLVQLLGWCHEKKELLLVYEFMPNGSLDYHLFQLKAFLKWADRYRIARGLASALLYLHEEWEQCVVHRDIKASNIMLDSNFNAKLGDFGLARLVDHGKGLETTMLAGTMGYLAPESLITGKANKESDVYSFGIVALEIACGRKPLDHKAQEGRMRLVEWVWDLYGTGKLEEAVDPKLGMDLNEREIECLMIVGLWCAHPDNNLRPSIRQAIHVLNFEAPLPILPSKMPVPTYIAPPLPAALVSQSYGTQTVSENSQNQPSSYSFSTDSSKFTASSTISSSPSAALLQGKS